MEHGSRSGADRNPNYDVERPHDDDETSRERGVDLRNENEVFQDHERMGSKGADAQLARLRDTLSEDQDGIIHLSIPAYEYDFNTNPFVGMGPTVRRTYEISRHLDVVFLHRFMYHDILVCGIRSREFVDELGRAAFVKHIRDTGGMQIMGGDDTPYDFLAMKFSPYVASDTTAAWFTRYHKQEPHSVERPQYPVDVWMIYDASAYQEVVGDNDFRRAYALRFGYDRRASLLGIAQIN